MRRAKLIVLFGTLLIALPTNANYVEVQRNAYIYAESNRFSQELDHINVDVEPNVTFILESTTLENGYYQVRLRTGPGFGWVYKSRVRQFPGLPPGTDLIDGDAEEIAPDFVGTTTPEYPPALTSRRSRTRRWNSTFSPSARRIPCW